MQPDPADIFKGKITMGGRPLENTEASREDKSAENRSEKNPADDVERVPFEEDSVPTGSHEDEDVFISHGESVFNDQDIFPDEKKKETEAWERKPKVSVLSNIPDIQVDESEEDDDEILDMRRQRTAQERLTRNLALHLNMQLHMAVMWI